MSETRSVNRDSFLSMHVFVVIKRRRASCKERVVGCRCYTLRALALTHTQPPPVHRGQCPGTGSVSCPPQQFIKGCAARSCLLQRPFILQPR